jgi:hypothetical protein
MGVGKPFRRKIGEKQIPSSEDAGAAVTAGSEIRKFPGRMIDRSGRIERDASHGCLLLLPAQVVRVQAC